MSIFARLAQKDFDHSTLADPRTSFGRERARAYTNPKFPGPFKISARGTTQSLSPISITTVHRFPSSSPTSSGPKEKIPMSSSPPSHSGSDLGASRRRSPSSSSLANALKEHTDSRQQMYQPSNETFGSGYSVWSQSYEPFPQGMSMLWLDNIEWESSSRLVHLQAPPMSMEPSTSSTASTGHWANSPPTYNFPPVQATQPPPSLVVTGPGAESGYIQSLRHAQIHPTPGLDIGSSSQNVALPSSSSLGPLEYLLQDLNNTPSHSTEGSPSSSFSGSPRSDILPGLPWSAQGSTNPGQVVYSAPLSVHYPTPASASTSAWDATNLPPSTYPGQWLDPRPSYSYQPALTDPLSMFASQATPPEPTSRARTSMSPQPSTSGQESSLKERTRRKRRIDPSVIRSARFISSPLSSSAHHQSLPPKRGPKRPEVDHIHITNIPCPNAECSAPTVVDDSQDGLVDNFACTYIDPANGRQCSSDFRRRGCRERHSGSHSGREAQDLTSGRISVGSARRVLWETIRLIEASDWGVVYSSHMPSNQLMEVNWAQNYEAAGRQIAAEFDVEVLRQQAQAVKDTLYELGRHEEPLPPDQKRIFPVELEQYQQFVRLATKRAATFERFYCTYPNCDADFTRADALARHCRTCHEKEKGKRARLQRPSVDGDTFA
ncbi:hypothetical protein M407DRAFT_20991 [Tulasnella calospora MUT 4182]|uniref:C2H2-type domain-containing protein n=1 Tax=Tulasnella calospora MUT 4182 TaxID=1051891 RepID=A0A0C3QF45_9AGAM|nr:hypothetical protein M407DRAFT_20991 [Tulasnella calospora MUT 4182]